MAKQDNFDWYDADNDPNGELGHKLASILDQRKKDERDEKLVSNPEFFDQQSFLKESGKLLRYAPHAIRRDTETKRKLLWGYGFDRIRKGVNFFHIDDCHPGEIGMRFYDVYKSAEIGSNWDQLRIS